MSTNLFPATLTGTINNIFKTTPVFPVMRKLIPATDTRITTADTAHPGRFLNGNEQQKLQKYKLDKRRSEYLTGRICGKISVINFFKTCFQYTIEMEQIEIINSKHGRPSLSIQPAPPYPVPDISISHSKEYVMAITSRRYCGVDIQKQKDSLYRVKEKYCLKGEQTILQRAFVADNELSQLAILWSAKEAIQKCLSGETMPYFTEIILQEYKRATDDSAVLTFALQDERTKQWPEYITVVAGIFRDYALAITTLKENR